MNCFKFRTRLRNHKYIKEYSNAQIKIVWISSQNLIISVDDRIVMINRSLFEFFN